MSERRRKVMIVTAVVDVETETIRITIFTANRQVTSAYSFWNQLGCRPSLHFDSRDIVLT
uniref:Uncharacterized protein n=1 Tax=Octopus bimaculoides TaxID=37653 RepID=A0A0L8HJC3_OCTBM